jgi:osmotically-inducible protein OsmY
VTVPMSKATRREILPSRGSSRRADVGLEAEYRLRRSGYLTLRDVSCDASAHGLQLRGRLPSYYLKQVAQAVVAEVEGVNRVINLIEVVSPECRPTTGRVRAAWRSNPTESD